MPRRITEDTASKSRTITENVRIRGDNVVVLASKNEADNPKFDRFDTDGRLEGMVLTSPIEEQGFKAYGARNSLNVTGQGTIPRTEPYWEQRVPLISGNTPPDANALSFLPPYALPPRLELVSNGLVGFTGGWHSVTWGYGIKIDGRLFVTNVAPLFTINIPQGLGLRITIPGGVPENVPLLVFGMSARFATQLEAANTATIYVQKEESTRPRVPSTVDMWGPYQRTKKMPFLSSQNETYLGSLPKPRVWTTRGGNDEYQAWLTGYFKTHFGDSRSFEIAKYSVRNKRVWWQPAAWKTGAVSWVPQFFDAEGNVREYSRRPKGARASQLTNIIENIPTANYESQIRDVDESGVEAPDSPLDVITIGQNIPPSGTQAWRLTRYGTDPDTQQPDESPPSPHTTITVPTGSVVRVMPPLGAGNWIRNSQASQLNNDGVPDGWSHSNSSGLTVDLPEPGVHEITDISNSTTNVFPLQSPEANCQTKPQLTGIAKVAITTRTSGRVNLIARQLNTDGSGTSFTLASFSAVGEYEVKFRTGAIANAQAGPGQPYAQVAYNPNVRAIKFMIEHQGVGATGVRNLTSRLWNIGIHSGLAHPRKRYSVDPRTLTPVSNQHDTSLSNESPELPYPATGYAYAVLNPPDSQRAVISSDVYVPGNLIEYFGTHLTPVTTAFFISGLRIPVKPQEQRTISIYLYWSGVTQAGTPLRAVVKSTDGRVLQDLGAFVSNETGDSMSESDADANGFVRRKITFISHDDAAYVELFSGGVGDGLWRIMGLQNEVGATMTEFTDDYTLQGSMVSTFNLAIPGVPDGEFKSLRPVKRLVAIDSDVTHVFAEETQVTSHVTFARIKHHDDRLYGEWTTDVNELVWPEDGRATVQVGTILSTTDLDESPELRAHYLDFERATDSNSYAYGTLCRGDGTEFDGTALVYDFPPIREEKPIVSEVYADNTTGFAVMGNAQNWARGWGIQCFLNSTAEEIMSLVGRGLETEEDDDDESGTVTVETRWRKKYRLRVTNINFPGTGREAYVDINDSDEKRWLLMAEGVEGQVIEQEDF